ncbi:MAG: hypothetical protein KAH38_05510 [Candidatus Hydrogenedentes bacterium]|nr:hypothetical protein [Candidatus Hydrogenedentota bacterium]
MITTTAWVVLGITNIPVYFFWAWLIFKDWDDFKTSLLFWFTPDVISLFRGQFFEDRWAEMKLGFWLACCGGCVFLEGLFLAKL